MSGRNSCSGGSSSRTVTGSPSIDSNSSMKSAFCSGSSAPSAASRSSSVSARISRSTSLAALAEEHVLGAAQADALGAEPAGAGGVLGVVGVGPHPQPAHPVGVGHDPVHGLDQFVGVVGAGVHPALEVLHDRGRHDGHLAEVDLAGGAVDGDDVALLDDVCRRARSSGGAWCRPPAPPRRTRRSCPCRGRRRRRARSCRRGEVRMPSAAIMPSRSSGLVSRRIRMTFSPERDHLTAVYESKTALPTAAPGRGGDAAADPLGLRARSRSAGTSAGRAARR